MESDILAVRQVYPFAYSKRENGIVLIFTGGMASRLITCEDTSFKAWRLAAQVINHFTG